ncbi:MAG: beta-N-acetylhexosaminidase, partial [Bryobacterales bacterium]|nr:beta-N-acetylhexosaminidase [Bryobacterales bacterium]
LSPLGARGYSVIPVPRAVELGPADFEITEAWGVEGHAGVAQEVTRELQERFGIRLNSSGAARVVLNVKPDSVTPGEALQRDRGEILRQCYRLELAPRRITITANAEPGLFYGAATLLQLVTLRRGRFWLPEGSITDWPDLGLRNIYWDDAHHLDRPETLRQAIRQAAYFKINGFTLKLEGHFQYSSAPAIVEPHALSPAEYRDLTAYAARYHVQLIPFLDAPAHIAFILKHPEYASLRAFPNSNYELCVVNPAAVKLMKAMFHELLDANPGVQYVYLSTDEPYYVGLADNPRCREKAAAEAKGSVGKLLASFVSEIADDLHARGRTVIFWGEFPLKVTDLSSLPRHIVNGEVNGPETDRAYRELGIRQMIYTSTQGEERLFPEYVALPRSRRLHARQGAERVRDGFRKIAGDTARTNSDLIGATVAGWGDSGLHAETFWLGYATIPSAAWNPNANTDELTASFYPLFYGPGVEGMSQVYQLLSYQAQAWWDLWEQTESTARKPIFGYSAGIYDPPKPARDQTLPLPPAPGADLTIRSTWLRDNAQRLDLADRAIEENDLLLGLLGGNLRRATANRYNVEVLLSIAGLTREGFVMLRDIARMLRVLERTRTSDDDDDDVLAAADQALNIAREIRDRRNRVYQQAVATWNRSQFPRVMEANGRRFRHDHDDVKDHLGDRTPDMSYLVLRELQLPFGEWVEQIRAARNSYAASHAKPLRQDKLDWRDLEGK